MAGITVDFNANLARLEDGINRANAQLSGFGANAERIGGAFSKTFAALGVGLSVAGVVAFGKSVIDTADDLNDLSLKTGIAVEQLSGLDLAANQSGTNLDAAASAINKLSKNIATNREEFAALGISATDPLAAFGQLADVFNSIDDPQQRAAFGAKALGKSWEDVAPLLSLGGQGLAEIVEQASAASGITTELAQASDEFNDSLAALQANARGLAVEGFAPLVPIMNELITYFGDTGDEADKLNESGGALKTTFKTVAEGIAVVDFGFQLAGKSIGALAAKLGDFLSGDFTGKNFKAIDQAFKEDVAAADKRLLEFFAKIEGENPTVNVDVKTNVDGGAVGQIDLSGDSDAIEQFLGNNKKTQDAIGESFKNLQTELKQHLTGIEGNIDDEVGLFNFRNRQLETALDLGLVDQETYFQKKQQLQQQQLAETEALLDQEINALKQFQSQATDEATKSGAQEQINELVRKKTELERDSQIATLENAATAQQALGDYAGSLIDINGLLEGVTSNIIGMSQAQAEVNFKTPDQGGATADDLADPNKIFRSADGTSFSDRPLDVGVALDLSQDEVDKFDQQLTLVKEQAVADSAILLNVSVDEAAAIAKINDSASAINQQLSELQPVTLNMGVDQQAVVDQAKQARDAAQAGVQPVIIPVIYQAQNTPGSAAPAGGNFDLQQTALASGGR